MEHSLYHKFLRVSAAVVAVVLLFDGGYIISETQILSLNVQNYLASVISVGASIQPSELNILTAEIAEKNKELNERESVIADREIAISLSQSSGGGNQNNISTYILSTILFILVVLIVLNYTLDYIRERERRNVIEGLQA